MRRGLLIMALGLVAALVAFVCSYLAGTATPRALLGSEEPELAWLKHEFNVSDAEFRRISDLHAQYLPQCRERCRQLDELNKSLARALAEASQLTPGLQKLLNERAQMRATCQAEMLKHFFEVSKSMPPEQGRRYLAWAQENTCLREEAMNHGPSRSSETPAAGHHP
jgi:hypothetical protein